MTVKDFLLNISDEIQQINDVSFDIEIINTTKVPNRDDKDITYENFEDGIKRVKVIETCVLYIDIRKSTSISIKNQPNTLSKLYSSFVRSMIKSARYYGGHVRNIIGDRVMVVFDTENCFINAINTAILMNTVAIKLLNKYFKNNEVKCGIGIDYGKMLITKVGTVVKGTDNPEYKSLVWLGKPANIASKLTDIANIKHDNRYNIISEGHYYPSLNKWGWYEKSYEEFIDSLDSLYRDGLLKHSEEYFCAFTKQTKGSSFTSPAILMTEKVYNELKISNPKHDSLEKNLWSIVNIRAKNYSGKIYGGNAFYSVIKEVE